MRYPASWLAIAMDNKKCLWPGCLLGGKADWTIGEIPVGCFCLSYEWSNSLINVITEEVQGSPRMADRAGSELQSLEGALVGQV